MRITHEDVRRIARLARLRLEPDDLDRLRGDLDAILTYMETLSEPDTRDIEPIASVTGPSGPLREDRPRATLANERALAGAPESGGGHFKVPRFIT